MRRQVMKRKGRGILAPALAVGAAVLGALALYVTARARRAEEEHPPDGRFITVGGVRLRYRDVGEGDAVVLIHGNGSLIEELEVSGLVDRLARNHRVILFDRPGFGYSERPRSRLWTAQAQAHLLNGALERLQVRRALVYGHSLGAQVAVELALLAPERVSALALASGYYYPTARPDVPLFAPLAVPVLGDAMLHTITPVLTERLLPRLYGKLFAPAPIPDSFRRHFPHGLVLRPSHLRATSEDTAFLIPNANHGQHHYAELRMPVTILTGDGDEVVFMHKHAQRLHGHVPQSRLVVVPGAGHMIHHTALDEVVEAVEALMPGGAPAPRRAGAGPERAAALHQAR